MQNWVSWFEIPATNFERAVQFYNGLFDIELHTVDMMGTKMGIFPADGPSGAVVSGEGYTPTENGTLVYLNGGEDLNAALNKITGLGGNVLVPKTHIGDGMGYFAIFTDTEGNKIALHSNQ